MKPSKEKPMDTNLKERWISVDGFDLYEVSNLGKVRNIRTSRILKPGIITKGYHGYKLYLDPSTAKSVKSHRLVAEAFIDNPNNYPQVNHINCDKADNRMENLEWCTNRMNMDHAIENGLPSSGETHHSSKLTEDEVRYIKSILSPNISALSRAFCVDRKTIRNIINGQAWRSL